MYDAAMRTTVDLPDDVHRIVRSLAHERKASMSRVLRDLVERGLGDRLPGATAERTLSIDEVTGLPVFRGGRVVTADDVRELLDEE